MLLATSPYVLLPLPMSRSLFTTEHAQLGFFPLSDLLVAPHDLCQILLQLDRIFLCGSISLCTLISNVFFVLWDLRSGHHTSNSCAFSAGPSSGMSTSYSPSRKRLVHIDYWWFFNHCSWVSLLCCFFFFFLLTLWVGLISSLYINHCRHHYPMAAMYVMITFYANSSRFRIAMETQLRHAHEDVSRKI